MAEPITATIAFVGGLVSFFSPCILPLIPGFLSYLGGTKIEDVKKDGLQKKVFLNSVLFVFGFSAVFIILGSLLGFIGESLPFLRIWLSRIGGAIIIIFGLWTMGFLKIGFLSRERGMSLRFKKYGYVGSGLVGASFGAGWTPCIGPILSIILGLSLSMSSAAEGAFLLSIYSLGLAIPFLITGLFTAKISKFISKYQEKREKLKMFFQILKVLGGIILIILGIFVFTRNLETFLYLFILPASPV